MAASFVGKKILIVDNDPQMVAALVRLLQDTGATLETAADGHAALEKAEAFDPDLVVLKTLLPKRSGHLVLELLKRSGKSGHRVPYVIMITSIEGKRQQVWAQSLGADDFFHKPFPMERMLERVEELLGS